MTEIPPSWTSTARRDQVKADPAPIPVVLAEPPAPIGSVLLVHGRNGAPEQVQIAEIARAYLARGWRVVAPELPHSLALPRSGPPGGISFAGHVRAAAQVWDWMAGRWPDRPRALAGHSIGGYAVAHLGAGSDAHHVLAVSPPMSGMVLYRARQAMGEAALDEVRREAPGYFDEMRLADAEPALRRLAAPLAVVTGAEDGLVRLADARAYFTAAPNGRFFGALPGQHHCPAGAACGQMLAVALASLGA
ncbi:MAG: alpha/beta fold hydrolase [Paracoccus sp. (in: a-proteobacteria)]|uniref:alpha/beta hydrolase n=1 Tax=Paracoccus sp. TaxID=267 RepID=UPI0039E37EFD